MPRTVTATYRLQLSPTFGLDAAAEVVPYLHRLGVSHLYTSPLTEATPGSSHGYDVTDHGRVRAELGGEAALRRLWEALADHGMGQILDIVPNHMGIRSATNHWWQSVLAAGPTSAYAPYFDIDWSLEGPGEGRITLPFLDRPLGDAIRGEIVRVERASSSGVLVAVHHDDRWPLSEESVASLGLGPNGDPARVAAVVDELRRSPRGTLDLLERQHWRAVPWRDAPTLLNWRRFFDITDLAAVQVQRPAVFDDVHALLRRWMHDDPLSAGVVDGVRIDHVDGLVDPQGYLERLRGLVGPQRTIVVEKILATDEALPPTWPVDGTTGYEAMARIDATLTSGSGADVLRAGYRIVTGDERSWSTIEATSRRDVAERILVPEARRAATELHQVVDALDRPVPLGLCAEVVRELGCALDVYRTYVRPGAATAEPPDLARIDAAAARVRQRRPDLAMELVELTTDLLTRRRGADLADPFISAFNQFSAPLAAKATEDTACYRFVPCSWLNEVGGDPSGTLTSATELHSAFAELTTRWPRTLVPLTTHDTKRSGDVRARLGRMSESPDATVDAIASWMESAARSTTRPSAPSSRSDPARAPEPSAQLQWLLWQTLVGAAPLSLDRAGAYVGKAMREAKEQTSWIDPDLAYEYRAAVFLERAMIDNPWTGEVSAFVAAIRRAGRASSLAQVVLATTIGLTPDVYQGDELWNLSLVDPDNRRAVDWTRRQELLDEIRSGNGPSPAERWAHTADDPDDDGAVKLHVLTRLLALRERESAPLSRQAPYRPLPTHGLDHDDVLAFRRGEDLAVIVPRRFMAPVGASIDIPAGSWHDVLGDGDLEGGPHTIADLTARLPVAVLRRR